MFSRYVMICSAVVLLGACSSTEKDVETSMNDGVMVEQTDGAGMESVYTDDTGPAPGTQADLVVNVGDRVFFETDSTDLTPSARTTLENQAAWLAQYTALGVTIEGHADERGTREYNLALGERRANSVKNYLVALGVAPSRITVLSYGKERPAVPGSNDMAWSQNRRGVTKVQ